MEALSLLLCVLSIVISSSVVRFITSPDSEIPLVNYTVGWAYALVYLPGTISIVYLFAEGEGRISKFFTYPIFMYLAKISPYAFLICNVVYTYISGALYVFIQNKDIYNLIHEQYLGWIKITIGLFLALVATQIWMWISMKMKKKKS